jgi:hypothetical protein
MTSSVKMAKRALFLLALFLLTGCMYRSEIQRQQANPLFMQEEIARVAAAVERYYKERGVYPIQNSDEEVPVYEKYIIDLNKLVQSNMLSSIPNNAFEMGGKYYYLLIHPETDPAVKLMDLVWVQRIGAIQRAVNAYASDHGRLPIESEVAAGFYTIDYELLSEERVMLQSAFSNHYLPLLLHESGRVLIDYSLDIAEAAKRSPNAERFPEGADAREMLIDVSPLSPILSFPYRWTNGEPVLTDQLPE